MPLHPSDLTDDTIVDNIPWKKLKKQLNSEQFDTKAFVNKLSKSQLETLTKLKAAQKEQGNMEPLERQSYYDEQDDYWLVMEMF